MRGLSFALEGAYIVTDPKGRGIDINRNAAFNSTVVGVCNAVGSNCFTKSMQPNGIAHLRIVRDF